MKSTEEIQQILEKEKSRIFAKYPIKNLAIYPTEKSKEDEEVYIMVESDKILGVRLMDLAEDLETKLEEKVHILSKDSLEKKYYREIKKEMIFI